MLRWIDEKVTTFCLERINRSILSQSFHTLSESHSESDNSLMLIQLLTPSKIPKSDFIVLHNLAL